MASERVMLLDTAALYFRAFYGVPDTVKAPNGMPINAVRGLLDMIARLVAEFEPTHLVACWDDDWRPQWRVDLIPSYKAHRVAPEPPVRAVPGAVPGDAPGKVPGNVPGAAAAVAPEEVPDLLSPQVPVIRDALTAIGIPIVGAVDHEADDVIGTLASSAAFPVDVVTGDRDLFQLVDDSRAVRVIYTGRGMSNLELVTDAVLVAKYGVIPTQYADFATMRGDASDGLPGVAGVGDKTAAALLATYGDLDGIIGAATDASSAMAASTRAKILAASQYLAVAPAVVRVVRDLVMPDFDARIRSIPPARAERLTRLTEQWGLGESMRRAVTALAARA